MALQQRAGEQELLGEDVLLHGVPAGVRGLHLDAQELLAVVPLVQRLGLVQALVALQAHQPAARWRARAPWPARSCPPPPAPPPAPACPAGRPGRPPGPWTRPRGSPRSRGRHRSVKSTGSSTGTPGKDFSELFSPASSRAGQLPGRRPTASSSLLRRLLPAVRQRLSDRACSAACSSRKRCPVGDHLVFLGLGGVLLGRWACHGSPDLSAIPGGHPCRRGRGAKIRRRSRPPGRDAGALAAAPPTRSVPHSSPSACANRPRGSGLLAEEIANLVERLEEQQPREAAVKRALDESVQRPPQFSASARGRRGVVPGRAPRPTAGSTAPSVRPRSPARRRGARAAARGRRPGDVGASEAASDGGDAPLANEVLGVADNALERMQPPQEADTGEDPAASPTPS